MLGDPVRYDGQGKARKDARISLWLDEQRLFRICPEVAGGLPTPRPPAELRNGDGHALLSGNASVHTKDGKILDQCFVAGAQAALSLAQSRGIKLALLKSNSPSCSNEHIYDGQFSGNRITGLGVTAALLQENGLEIFNEHQLDELENRLVELDDSQI